ncbi:hypothetical protein E4416_12500 [Stenotrophomonas maltophilia]|uniref:McrB family protein n=1 Tax=Stenotrophomonas maltophilia TaxID=40324 RepID=UPI001110A664|nr:AAA family ATPase [Stenotrophomonas maltophilia]TIK65875.1 hypothetical protein E4418_14520 [Stenotrophomonas maltophilia]TIK71513.1 hypothetical protein E4416_12500 [Stenotrophomonas maltophilia]
MITDNDKIYNLAVAALRSMVLQFGPDHRFPPDAIWQQVPENEQIPSTKKPHQPRRLIKEGYLRDTGAKTRAQSGPRAGSTTNLYEFGPKLVSAHNKLTPVVTTLATTDAVTSLASDNAKPSEALKAIQEVMEAEGYLISVAELANFLLALTVCPLVILSGISGTGKSLLPRKFAKHTNSQFHAIPVQPQWSDNSDLFGFVPTLSPTKFVEGKLVKCLREAKYQPDKLVIVLLDEMNLAPVEHYFSDFLSVAESRERKGARIGSDPLPIELPAVPVAGLADPEADLRGIELPSNLRVIGTANMDETTHSFSPKVLDRAFTIEFDDPDLNSFASATHVRAETFENLANIVIDSNNAISVLEARAASQELFEFIANKLSEIQDILAPAGVKFGYRTRDAVLLYLHFWRQFGLSEIMAGYAALDFCILQKILPKVSGSGELLADALDKLAVWLQAPAEPVAVDSGVAYEFSGPLERSHQKVLRMSEILKLDGSTRYWGA